MVFKFAGFIISGFTFVFLFINGCAPIAEKVKPTVLTDQNVQAPVQVVCEPSHPSEGSLWTDKGYQLFLDQKARWVGDTVTVDIVENASSSVDANTKASRSSSIDAGVSNLGGYMRALEAKNKNLNRDQDGNLTDRLFQADMENEFTGKGTSDRSGRITASIGARVIEVLPNGNLVLSGRREMTVNNEAQFITVAGIIRPEDIGPDNRVKSIYMADSRITYSGKGVIADKQKPGWLSRLLDQIWPF